MFLQHRAWVSTEPRASRHFISTVPQQYWGVTLLTSFRGQSHIWRVKAHMRPHSSSLAGQELALWGRLDPLHMFLQFPGKCGIPQRCLCCQCGTAVAWTPAWL